MYYKTIKSSAKDKVWLKLEEQKICLLTVNNIKIITAYLFISACIGKKKVAFYYPLQVGISVLFIPGTV